MSDYTYASPPAKAVGVRELKAQAARIVREVREEHASYVVTQRGEPVGVLLPVDAAGATAAEPTADPWTAFLRVGKRLERLYKPGTSGVKLVSNSRR